MQQSGPRDQISPGLPVRHRSAEVVEQADLDAGQRTPVGGQPLALGIGVVAAGDRGVLGGAVHPDQRQAEGRGPLGDRQGDGRAAEADEVHQLEVLVGAVRMVEQAGQEVRGPGAAGQSVLAHDGQEAGRVPHVGEVHGVALQHRDQQRAEHAHGVAHRGPGQGVTAAGGPHGAELAHLGADGPVGVDHPFRVGRRPRRVGDDRGRGGGHLPPGRQRPRRGLQLVEVEEPAGAVVRAAPTTATVAIPSRASPMRPSPSM